MNEVPNKTKQTRDLPDNSVVVFLKKFLHSEYCKTYLLLLLRNQLIKKRKKTRTVCIVYSSAYTPPLKKNTFYQRSGLPITCTFYVLSLKHNIKVALTWLVLLSLYRFHICMQWRSRDTEWVQNC